MSQKGSKNGNILTFFKPVASPSSQRHASPKPSSPKPSSSLPTPSSPTSQLSTPVKPAPPRRADLEIGASDEDGSGGSDSDNSLEQLSTLLGRGRAGGAAPARAPGNPLVTPKAKRTAFGFHTSPLTIMPKHKFDLKALTKDARRDDATNASSMRISALQDESDTAAEAASRDHASGSAFVDIVREKGGHDAQKVLRAVQRAEPGQSQLRYCFFDMEYRTPSSGPAPKSATKGPWRLLTQGSSQVRELHLVSGVPQTLLKKGKGLPDELFEWLLDEICVQNSAIVLQEYCNLIAGSPEQVERLLTPERLQSLFFRLGALEGPKSPDVELKLSTPGEEPYQERDWSSFRSFLSLLWLVSENLSSPSARYTAHTLLRLSLDKVLMYNMDLLNEYGTTIQYLVSSIPSSQWESFCLEACVFLHKSVKSQCIRVNALLCIPICHGRLHELRRRMAVACLFDDLNLGRHEPEDVVTLRGVIDRLNQQDFSVGPHTDFAELKAGIILLDMVIDDGSIAPTTELDDEKQFNADVDELAQKLRNIWRKINDSGMKLARTETKSVIEWVQQRLSHTVRTKRKPKKNVFDVPGPREDHSLPQQQDYMKNFLKMQ